LDDISNRGNNTKHGATDYPTDATQLRQNFRTLEKLILKAIDNTGGFQNEVQHFVID
jgi:hypothetical protein